MGRFPKKMVKLYFKKEGLLDEVVKTITHDKEHADKMATDFADEICAIMKKDPGFKRRVLEGTILNPKFEKEILKKIRERLS